MGKSIVHVLVPYTTKAACGCDFPYITAGCRESVTCKQCKKTEQFKLLRNKPKGKK